jgi:hypothetical protein
MLAKRINVNSNQIKELLDGEPTKGRNWFNLCEQLLFWLLQEITDHNTTGHETVLLASIRTIRERIRQFFFRDATPTVNINSPIRPFFAFERRLRAAPCSMRELSQEIGWFARQPEVGAYRTRLTVVLGNTMFPSHDPRGLILSSLRDAVQGDADLSFILPRFGNGMNGLATIQQFESLYPEVKGRFQCYEARPEGIHELCGVGRRVASPLSDAGIAFPWGHLLCMQSLEASDEPQEISVYLQLRNFTPNFPPPEDGPVAMEATPADIEAFRVWRERWQLASAADDGGGPIETEPSTEGREA